MVISVDVITYTQYFECMSVCVHVFDIESAFVERIWMEVHQLMFEWLEFENLQMLWNFMTFKNVMIMKYRKTSSDERV